MFLILNFHLSFWLTIQFVCKLILLLNLSSETVELFFFLRKKSIGGLKFKEKNNLKGLNTIFFAFLYPCIIIQLLAYCQLMIIE